MLLSPQCWLMLSPLFRVSSLGAVMPPAAPLQALSNSCWALSKLNISNEALLDALVAAATNKIHSFNAQNIANTVSLFGLFNQGMPSVALLAQSQCFRRRKDNTMHPFPCPLREMPAMWSKHAACGWQLHLCCCPHCSAVS